MWRQSAQLAQKALWLVRVALRNPHPPNTKGRMASRGTNDHKILENLAQTRPQSGIVALRKIADLIRADHANQEVRSSLQPR